MNKKKNQTSIDLDAIMTEVLNLFTPEEQQEVIDILWVLLDWGRGT